MFERNNSRTGDRLKRLLPVRLLNVKRNGKMDLLNGKIQTLNRKYLNAAFGSVLILILPLILNASAIW